MFAAPQWRQRNTAGDISRVFNLLRPSGFETELFFNINIEREVFIQDMGLV